MTEIRMEERISIRDSARALKKYGSTVSTGGTQVRRQENYLKHQVAETDTLQGLSLRYGVTMEQIRRANRLWANDSLFLRKSLLIPVSGDSLSSPSEIVLFETGDQAMAAHNGTNNNNNNKAVAMSDPTYNDFLVKIDCSIASMKSQVMMSQDNSQFVDNDSLFVRRKSAMSRLKQQQQQQTGSDVPVVKTQGRRVANSLQRLEREQDELFQL